MAESQIEWTDVSWNPIVGCSIQSEGCKNCYAMHYAKRLELMGMQKYHGLTRRSGNRTIWNGKVRENIETLEIPLRWRKPRRIFVNSMSDLFHEKVAFEFLDRVWEIMKSTPHHQFQILTKRPDRMAEFVKSRSFSQLENVWLGTSIENGKVKSRLKFLKKIPAAVRFISFEPLIGSVGKMDLTGINWAIVGGESGQNARPIREIWIDEIFNQCMDQKIAFFFKQWGAWGSDSKKRSKKANGRQYRGQHWDEMPILLSTQSSSFVELKL